MISCLFFLFLLLHFAAPQANIGCFFAASLCQPHESCFDDDAFGQCGLRPPTRSRVFSSDQLARLETEMKRLYFFGFRWDQPYTQCVLKRLLDDLSPSLCLPPPSSQTKRTDTRKPGPAKKSEQQQLAVDTTQAFVLFRHRADGERFVVALEQILKLPRGTFSNIRERGKEVTFKVNPNARGLNASLVAAHIEKLRDKLRSGSGLEVEETGIGADVERVEVPHEEPGLRRITIVAVVIILAALGSAIGALWFRRRKKKFSPKEEKDSEEGGVESLYQELCRQRMQSGGGGTVKEELDIGTGHLVLRVMEEYARDEERVSREWERLCAYEAEGERTAGAENMDRNRFNDVLPLDHARVRLQEAENDYINASAILDHHPLAASYILAQGPLPHTRQHFWQMVHEQGVSLIVNLTRLQENGVEQCSRYWPESGSAVYGQFEVHLVSEHIWSDDFLVRSFYLKNLKTSDTRTVSQFHFLAWPVDGLPSSTTALLDFRRKVNKSFRGKSSPILVHCSDGVGRSGCFCLLDMVLNRVLRGAKEIDLEATLEHIRDQRGGAVRTRAQYELVLQSLAEEISSFLK